MRIELILANWPLFAGGVWMTLQLTFLPLALGFLIALPAGLARARSAPKRRNPARWKAGSRISSRAMFSATVM